MTTSRSCAVVMGHVSARKEKTLQDVTGGAKKQYIARESVRTATMQLKEQRSDAQRKHRVQVTGVTDSYA